MCDVARSLTAGRPQLCLKFALKSFSLRERDVDRGLDPRFARRGLRGAQLDTGRSAADAIQDTGPHAPRPRPQRLRAKRTQTHCQSRSRQASSASAHSQKTPDRPTPSHRRQANRTRTITHARPPPTLPFGPPRVSLQAARRDDARQLGGCTALLHTERAKEETRCGHAPPSLV